ncbi:uncharacterized protein LOC114339043 isoform X1 [Diabrotica virgifera virgifera]|uniref:Uncharacterized protein n=1 Tax=Diabrotica virgifera virgifera TaxID=50390 RepID=A0ABM5KAY9_DIAVI|nr:uncharacterized protein LOC114339043 isoform X1 [Diabrotica virgifera virgifera]
MASEDMRILSFILLFVVVFGTIQASPIDDSSHGIERFIDIYDIIKRWIFKLLCLLYPNSFWCFLNGFEIPAVANKPVAIEDVATAGVTIKPVGPEGVASEIDLNHEQPKEVEGIDLNHAHAQSKEVNDINNAQSKKDLSLRECFPLPDGRKICETR